MGFDYEIQYKMGKENVVADGLSRLQDLEFLCMAITVAHSNLEDSNKQSYARGINLHDVLLQLEEGQSHNKFTLQNEFIRRKGKICVRTIKELRHGLIHWQHCSPEGGHGGRDLTTRRLKALLNWPGLTKDVRQFVKSRVTCQAAKHDNI